MNTLKILDCDNSERVFEFVGWRTDRQALFLLDTNQKRRVLQLVLPCPDKGHYSRNPFPDFAPVHIKKARLMPPPCRGTKEEAEHIFDGSLFGTVPDPWETAYGQALYLAPEDDPALLERLEAYKSEQRREYEIRKKELASLTAADVKAVLFGEDSDKVPSPEQVCQYIEEQSRFVELLFNAPLRKLEPDGPWVAGHLNVSLEMVKEDNAGGIRDHYLHQQWAQQHGFDLRTMRKEKSLFLSFIEEHVVNLIENVHDARTRTRYEKLGLRLWREEENLLCVSVRYTIHFSNGTRLWLKDCPIRDVCDSAEAAQFDACCGKTALLQKEELLVEKHLDVASKIQWNIDQLAARQRDLKETLQPLTSIYSEPAIVEVRKRANGAGVPDAFADWAIAECQNTGYDHLPTKGEAFRAMQLNPLREQLQALQCGCSEPTAARWLGTIREALRAHGLLKPRSSGQAPKVDHYAPSVENMEDITAPSPADEAAERLDASSHQSQSDPLHDHPPQ